MLLQICSSAFLFHLIMKQYYPREYTSILIFLTEHCIFAYSYIELNTKKIYKQIKNHPSVSSFTKQLKSSNNIEVILNSNSVNYLNKESIYSNVPFENTFIIYSDSQPMSCRTNKIIIHKFSKNTPKDVFNYKLCNYMFISTILYLEVKSLIVNYDLRLFCDGNNYFVANNKIDKYVICYMLNQQKNVTFSPETCKYKLSIIDQNANMIDLSEKDVLYLNEDNYEIVQVISENIEYSDKENEENESTGSSVGSKEYEIIENDNN